jgi:predicted DNA-binding transcriptional regulator AlpA
MTVIVQPKLLKPEVVSEMLGITTHTLAIWRCTKRVNLPYAKIGRAVRYRTEDVCAFITRQLKDAA